MYLEVWPRTILRYRLIWEPIWWNASSRKLEKKRFVFTKQGLPSYVSHSGPRSRWPRHRCRKFPLILEREAILLSVSREAIITGGFYAGQILEVARWAPLAPSSTCRHVMLNKFEYIYNTLLYMFVFLPQRLCWFWLVFASRWGGGSGGSGGWVGGGLVVAAQRLPLHVQELILLTRSSNKKEDEN